MQYIILDINVMTLFSGETLCYYNTAARWPAELNVSHVEVWGH